MDGEFFEVILIGAILFISWYSSEKQRIAETDLAKKVEIINNRNREIWREFLTDYLNENKLSESGMRLNNRSINFDNYEDGRLFYNKAYVIIGSNALHFVAHYSEYNSQSPSIKNDVEYSSLFEKVVPFNSKIISFRDILYYGMEGNISTNAIVSSSGGGSSITGALVGGAIAGDAGAIIGSRKKNIVSTTLRTTDSRKIEIYFRENGSDTRVIIEDPDIYKQLLIKIPEKEISNYLNSNTKQESVISSENIEEKLSKLKNLLDKGYIDETEYKKLRSEILDTFS